MKRDSLLQIARWALCLAMAGCPCQWDTARSADQSWIIYGQLERQVYTNLPGVLLTDLTSAAAFPDQPDFTDFIDTFETPSLSGNNYGERVTGFLVSPVSGEYVFYLASDDQGAVFLSTDPWAAHKTRIAFEPEWAFPRFWTGPASGRTNQENVSPPVRLEEGQLYFVEGLHKQAWGGDNFSVAWQMPDGLVPETGSPPIPSDFLARPGPGFDANAPVVRLISPTNNAVFKAAVDLPLAAYAQAPTQSLISVEFFADNLPIGKGFNVLNSRQFVYLMSWSNAPEGEHILTASATDSAGRSTTSTPVKITVEPSGAAHGFVTRTVVRNSVRLLAEPLANVTVYALEDQQPSGWAAVNISDDGLFDEVTGKVKFGPFFDHEPRTMTYDSAAPPDFAGTAHLTGRASADGINTPISGDDQIIIAPTHPADVNPADWTIGLDEVTAYAAAWRSGSTWALGPVPIPIDYVTRAAALWRGGESYTVDTSSTPPLWWIDVVPREQLRLLEDSEKTVSAIRCLTPTLGQAAGSLEVQLQVAPPAGGLAFAIEESPPPGSLASNISQAGQLDTVSGKIKWGPFLDATPRTFSYRCALSGNQRIEAKFAGTVSCDGRIQAVAGPDQWPCNSWSWSARPHEGKWTLILTSPQDVGLEIQTSTNLTDWSPLARMSNTPGHVEILLDTGSGIPQKYFRARVMP